MSTNKVGKINTTAAILIQLLLFYYIGPNVKYFTVSSSVAEHVRFRSLPWFRALAPDPAPGSGVKMTFMHLTFTKTSPK